MLYIRAHSIGVLLVRSLDIPVQFRGQLKWQGVLQIHPGPSHGGKNVHVLIQLIVDELKVRDRAIAMVYMHNLQFTCRWGNIHISKIYNIGIRFSLVLP